MVGSLLIRVRVDFIAFHHLLLMYTDSSFVVPYFVIGVAYVQSGKGGNFK